MKLKEFKSFVKYADDLLMYQKRISNLTGLDAMYITRNKCIVTENYHILIADVDCLFKDNVKLSVKDVHSLANELSGVCKEELNNEISLDIKEFQLQITSTDGSYTYVSLPCRTVLDVAISHLTSLLGHINDSEFVTILVVNNKELCKQIDLRKDSIVDILLSENTVESYIVSDNDIQRKCEFGINVVNNSLVNNIGIRPHIFKKLFENNDELTISYSERLRLFKLSNEQVTLYSVNWYK